MRIQQQDWPLIAVKMFDKATQEAGVRAVIDAFKKAGYEVTVPPIEVWEQLQGGQYQDRDAA